ncbi:DUF3278 domain-containing protein [Metabacillus malikii]|uniref:Cobalamin synthase n=1 Tax=Metabacillus malikii TaxID=1504265 RepID=A0ABT9ZEU9_9BACI|nr:DUF3278 domain-containing protein [Metabacillus malikii]MDQ0229790.1 cobalamin synthase [Metabacillus malikii]
MNSWLSIILPSDEYKEKKMLYFFAEGAVVMFICTLLFLLASKYVQLDVQFSLLIILFVFVAYVTIRYILSGVEYTDVSTEESFKKEFRVITRRSIVFVLTSILLYTLLIELPSGKEWYEVIGLFILAGILMFLTSYVSLRRSYIKNKELL